MSECQQTKTIREFIHGLSEEQVHQKIRDLADKHIQQMFYNIQTDLGSQSGDNASYHLEFVGDKLLKKFYQYIQAYVSREVSDFLPEGNEEIRKSIFREFLWPNFEKTTAPIIHPKQRTT